MTRVVAQFAPSPFDFAPLRSGRTGQPPSVIPAPRFSEESKSFLASAINALARSSTFFRRAVGRLSILSARVVIVTSFRLSAGQEAYRTVCQALRLRSAQGERKTVCAERSPEGRSRSMDAGLKPAPDVTGVQHDEKATAYSPRSARNLASAPGRRSTGPNVLLGRAERTREPLRSRSFSRSSSVGSRRSRIEWISATGSPRYETVTVLPSRTCRMTSENRAFASYIE